MFDDVVFQGFPTAPTSVALIDVTAVGSGAAARTIQFNNTQLQTTLGSGGLYVRVASSNPFAVNLIMNGSNDPTGGPPRPGPPPPPRPATTTVPGPALPPPPPRGAGALAFGALPGRVGGTGDIARHY
ncbi:MAG: hypothetical protein IPO73_11920 [Gemmatimonadetes bacterium]|nr:hypothetical protein [Gemmatimonadota bacterium]